MRILRFAASAASTLTQSEATEALDQRTMTHFAAPNAASITSSKLLHGPDERTSAGWSAPSVRTVGRRRHDGCSRRGGVGLTSRRYGAVPPDGPPLFHQRLREGLERWPGRNQRRVSVTNMFPKPAIMGLADRLDSRDYCANRTSPLQSERSELRAGHRRFARRLSLCGAGSAGK